MGINGRPYPEPAGPAAAGSWAVRPARAAPCISGTSWSSPPAAAAEAAATAAAIGGALRGASAKLGLPFDDAVGSSLAAEVRDLSERRAQLLRDVRAQEAQEADELGRARLRIVAAEAAARERRREVAEERASCEALEEVVERFEGSLSAATLGALRDANERHPGSVAEALTAEISELRLELTASLRCCAALDARQQRLEHEHIEESVAVIRAGAQENQAMEASHQMAHAHLTALDAMAQSSSAQVQVREGVLYALLRQVEEHEGLALQIQERTQEVEQAIAFRNDEIWDLETQSWLGAQEHEQRSAEHDEAFARIEAQNERLQSDVSELEREANDACDRLRSVHDPERGEASLRQRIRDLHVTCEEVAEEARDTTAQHPLLQAEVARLSRALQEELLWLHEHEEEHRLHEQSRSVDRMTTLGELEAEASAEIRGRADIQRLAIEEQTLNDELAASQQRLAAQRLEASTREAHFDTIAQDLRQQLASLHAEFQSAAGGHCSVGRSEFGSYLGHGDAGVLRGHAGNGADMAQVSAMASPMDGQGVLAPTADELAMKRTLLELLRQRPLCHFHQRIAAALELQAEPVADVRVFR
eukprot:TRINITY_DN3905_c0_g2_i1.p1 TRINITY_DN3905_c0_g2~~TRINITY_DN3905_c0_g2_i1.p1  ORF type:complete len:621 (+),score=140.92 TRINITY_DN3905_c0_g2_i1:90-1865(+)